MPGTAHTPDYISLKRHRDDRHLVGIEGDVDLRQPPGDDSHVLHARWAVELVLDAELVGARQ